METTESILALLAELDQKEVLERYSRASSEEQKFFIEDFKRLDKACQGGIKDYIIRAKALLQDNKDEIDHLKDVNLKIPTGVTINAEEPEFYELEKIGLEYMKDTTFCLVAGGLGERLKYNGIKINIPTELITLRSYIELYCDYIKAYENRVKKIYGKELPQDWDIPFAIMTSEDTNDKTVALFEHKKYFGLKKSQIFFIKQEKFPALIDNDCHLSLLKEKFLIETKPHGHGDVHGLLYSSGLSRKWTEMGKKYLIIFQDTNILIFNCVLSAIGASVKYNMAVNAVCVERKPSDQVNSVCEMVRKDGTSYIKYAAYSSFNALLKTHYPPGADIPDENGLSKFPGNINIFVIDIPLYNKSLEKTKGVVPEVVNPKYADTTRTKFKASTRLESNMQDLTIMYNEGENISFTVYKRWFCFSACKNDLVSACNKFKNNQNPESAWSTEQDFFNWNEIVLKQILNKLEIDEREPKNKINVHGVNLNFGPKIIIDPTFAVSLSEIKEKLDKMKGKIKMTNNSTLIIKNDITIDEGIDLDGNLVVNKDAKEKIICKNKERFIYYTLKDGEGENYEQIRGYSCKLVGKKLTEISNQIINGLSGNLL